MFFSRQRHIVVGFVLAAGLAGCGGSGGPGGSSLTPAAYRTKVDRICSTTNAKVEALRTGAVTVSLLQRAITVEQGGLNEIKAIDPPASLKADVGSWVSVLGHAVTTSGTAVTAIKQGKRDELNSIGRSLASLDTQTHAKATTLDLPECARTA